MVMSGLSKVFYASVAQDRRVVSAVVALAAIDSTSLVDGLTRCHVKYPHYYLRRDPHRT